MATIGSLAVNIEARTGALQKGLKKANRHVDTFSGRISSNISKLRRWHTAIAGVAGVTGFGFLIKRQIAAIDAIGKTSDRLGISVRALSQLQHAARLSGVRINTFEMGLQRMIRRVSEAAHGTGEAQDAIRELGLSATSLAKMAPEDQFGAMADALNRVSTQTERVRLAFKLFDSEGVRLLQLTKAGSAGLAAMADESDRLGRTLNDIDVQKIKALNDQLERTGAAWEGVQRSFTTKFATPATEALEVGLVSLQAHMENLGRFFRGVGSGNIRRGLTDFTSGFFETVAEARERRQEMLAQRIGQEAQERLDKREAPRKRLEEIVERAGKLGDEFKRLTGGVGDVTQRLQLFSRSALFGERFWRNLRPTPVEDIQQQGQAFAKFFQGLSFQPTPFPGRTGVNAALEQGTREAYIQSRAGQRRQHLARIAEQQKKEIKIAEATKAGIDKVVEALKSGLQTISIP